LATRAGDRFAGPAIISQLDATTLVLPTWIGEIYPAGAILLTMRIARKELPKLKSVHGES
jgi:hypothetical protein